MALGTCLTISDYLGMRQGADVRDRERGLIEGANLLRHKDFGVLLSSCLKETTGLTAADYLENPILARSVGIKKYLEASFEMDLRNISSSLEKLVEPTDPLVTQNWDENKLEKPGDNPALEAIERSINKAARKYDLAPDLIRGVIQAESDFQVRAESSAGAMGLMQLMPATAKDLGVKDPYDIEQNIDGGTRYLRSMLDRFGSDLKKALAAYNAGPGTVERYGGRVPYQETRQYVERVLEYSGLKA